MMKNSYAFTRYYYTLLECLKYTCNDEGIGTLPENTWAISQQKWTALLNARLNEFHNAGEASAFAKLLSGTPAQLKSFIVDLLNTIFQRHREDYIVSTDEEWEDNLEAELRYAKKVDDFYITLFSKILYTLPYYEKLITLYQSNESALMNDLTSSLNEVNKNSDTPQNIDSTLYPLTSDGHVSFVSQRASSSTIQNKDVMEKLDNVRKSYRNLILDWANDFDGIFLEGNNL